MFRHEHVIHIEPHYKYNIYSVWMGVTLLWLSADGPAMQEQQSGPRLLVYFKEIKKIIKITRIVFWFLLSMAKRPNKGYYLLKQILFTN